MSDHARFQAAATKQIDKHGRDIILIQLINGGEDYDPSIEQIQSTVRAVQTRFTRSEINGTTVLSSDYKYLIDSSVTPTIGGKIVDGEDEYSIVGFYEVGPGEQSILFEVQARR